MRRWRHALRVRLACWLCGWSIGFMSASLPGADYLADWARMKDIVPRHYICGRSIQPIRIDGLLDEPDWERAPWTEDFVDIEGDARPKPRFRTRAKMLWDERYLYVAAELEEPDVWATLTIHDSVIFQDPDFEVFIDPDGDSHEYYEFEMNARNTTWDLFLKKPYKDGGPALNEWEIPGLKTAVHVEGTLNNPMDRDRGWTLEIAFPWTALREWAHRATPPGEGDQWRISFSRVEWSVDKTATGYRKIPGTKEDNWVWSPQGIIDMHRPEKWGYVQFTHHNPAYVAFLPDISTRVRNVLQEIYYEQKAFYGREKRWASTLDELGLPATLGSGLAEAPTLALTADGFTVTAAIKRPNGVVQRWHIRQDARVWKE